MNNRSLVRILVVEDHVLWQEFVVRRLREQPGLQIIGVAADGLEAVQKAEELQPDLVLLDIGLPKLNGLEVAKRVRRVAPGARILFVSQESSSYIAQEAVRVGGLGYFMCAHCGRQVGPKDGLSITSPGWGSMQGLTVERYLHKECRKAWEKNHKNFARGDKVIPFSLPLC